MHTHVCTLLPSHTRNVHAHTHYIYYIHAKVNNYYKQGASEASPLLVLDCCVCQWIEFQTVLYQCLLMPRGQIVSADLPLLTDRRMHEQL